MEFLCDVGGLEGAVGTRQLPPLLKSIDFLDEHCTALLARSPIAVLGFRDRDGGLRAAPMGGAAGFASAISTDRLRLPGVDGAVPGSPASTMFLISGWREALRINGHLDADDASVLVVEEAFVHCGKAVLRSKLWGEPGPRPTAPAFHGEGPLDAEVRSFLAASPFVTLVSQDGAGGADASPKGDPAGFIRVLDDTTIALPDRKGNRRTDTFHNLLDDPSLALVAFVPGDDRTLELRGTARITDDEALRQAMEEQGKVPNAALVVEITAAELAVCPAISSSRIWDPATHQDLRGLPKAGQIWTDHIKANGTKGLKAAAIRAAVNGSIVQRGTEVEYQRSLY